MTETIIAAIIGAAISLITTLLTLLVNASSMSADELGNKEFASCLHELSGNDRVRLRELKKIDVYEDVVRYMLHNNVKLEQEIVSLTLMRNETNS